MVSVPFVGLALLWVNFFCRWVQRQRQLFPKEVGHHMLLQLFTMASSKNDIV